jgi:hypothetical protein
MKSIEDSGTGKGREFFASLSAPPWNIPQSTRNRTPDVWTRMQEPVTSLAAPRKVTTMLTERPS